MIIYTRFENENLITNSFDNVSTAFGVRYFLYIDSKIKKSKTGLYVIMLLISPQHISMFIEPNSRDLIEIEPTFSINIYTRYWYLCFYYLRSINIYNKGRS